MTAAPIPPDAGLTPAMHLIGAAGQFRNELWRREEGNHPRAITLHTDELRALLKVNTHATPSPDGGDASVTQEMIAEAWKAFRAGRPGPLIGPGFVEALRAALAVDPVRVRESALLAEVEKLKNQICETLDLLHKEIAQHDFAADRADAAEALASSLSAERDRLAEIIAKHEARVKVLEEALRPFVVGSDVMETILFGNVPDDKTGTITTRMGDFRRARAALSAGKDTAL